MKQDAYTQNVDGLQAMPLVHMTVRGFTLTVKCIIGEEGGVSEPGYSMLSDETLMTPYAVL